MRRRKTLECNIVAQRMELQEHFLRQEDDIFKEMEDLFQNEELYK